MKSDKTARKICYTVFFLLFTVLILTHSKESLYYALNGLNLWFTKMIPALFPFMILSGIMIRLNLTEGFATLLYPVLYPVFRVRKNVCYAIIMGFLCGFPMGARVTADLLERNRITQREASFLLAFCNNIGPVYFCSFVLPLLERRLIWPYIVGMYALPFLYGIFLRYTVYQDLSDSLSRKSSAINTTLQACSYQDKDPSLSLLYQIDDAITAAIQSILMLGGYMILFNLLNLIPGVLLSSLGTKGGQTALLLSPVLEITGGLGMMGYAYPLAAFLLLPFGGFSCIAQTYSMIKATQLSLNTYVIHKLILTAITFGYYLSWFFLSPATFLL